MSNVNSLQQRRPIDHDNPYLATDSASSAQHRRPANNTTPARSFDAQNAPVNSEHQASLNAATAAAAAAAAAAASGRSDAGIARLDALRDAYSGPYHAEGQTISVPPQFRMNTGFNQKNADSHRKEVIAICKKAHIMEHEAAAALGGYASPKVLAKVTQALIDAGKLKPGSPSTLGTRIRDMQWEYGIGVDCAGYTRHAMSALGKGNGLAAPGTESFRGLGANPKFKRLDPATVSTGDVMTLHPRSGTGHNVVVRRRDVVDGFVKPKLENELPPEARAFLNQPGPIHAIQVDSSWGAGANGDAVGGYRSDIWLYNESTKEWGYVDKHTTPPKFHTSTVGPHEESARAWRHR